MGQKDAEPGSRNDSFSDIDDNDIETIVIPQRYDSIALTERSEAHLYKDN